MGYKERVLERINDMEQRADERRALWQTISDSFEKEGADGVAEELARQMAVIHEKSNAMLAKLEEML
jgi:hypothetical protein